MTSPKTKSLSQWISHMPFVEKRHFREAGMTGLSFNSQTVKPGHLFVAIPGLKVDGHDFIPQALEAGASAVVVERSVSVPQNIPIFKVKNSREALSHLAAKWWDHPSEALHLTGVTGTNGKTTLCFLLESIFKTNGQRSGRLGTLGYTYGDIQEELNHTTPESTEIHKILQKMKQHSVSHVVMEVSSHAIDLHRVDHVSFDQAIFTNLTPEHLDYHKSMELYFESKKRLFTQLLKKSDRQTRAIINVGDPYGQKLMRQLKDIPIWTYSTERPVAGRTKIPTPDFYPLDWQANLSGLQTNIITPNGELTLNSPLIGVHNLSNLLGAIAAGLGAQISLHSIKNALENFNIVPGRLERIQNTKQLHVFVDYAHTPDALKNVLSTLRTLAPQKIITVFGCGGDRDREKRPLMGKEVARFSDFAIVTSDNPRTEDPQKIIAEILPGMESAGMRPDQDFQVIPDRRQAIQQALNQAAANDVVLIAGKGHENYQIIDTQKLPFDDREIAKEFL